MGTPDELATRELKPPTIAEKVQILGFGRKTGDELNSEKLHAILERMKLVLSPLVQWLDKPITDIWKSAPARFKNKRAMPVLDGSVNGSIFFGIALERSGNWIVRNHNPDCLYKFSDGVSSDELAVLILQEEKFLIKLSLRNHGSVEDFMANIGFMKKIAVYNGILCFVSECFRTVEQAIKEREARIGFMKERLALGNDFAQSLDPLLSDGRRVDVPDYSIWNNDRNGSSLSVGGYFSPGALEPFWNYLDSRPTKRFGYTQESKVSQARSLAEFLERIVYRIWEISKARSERMTDAKSLFGHNIGRLPLTGEEVVTLKVLAESIIGKLY